MDGTGKKMSEQRSESATLCSDYNFSFRDVAFQPEYDSSWRVMASWMLFAVSRSLSELHSRYLEQSVFELSPNAISYTSEFFFVRVGYKPQAY